MISAVRPSSLVRLATSALLIVAAWPQSRNQSQDFLVTSSPTGSYGGRLVAAQRAEPKTLNPISAVDGPSREIIRLMSADLIHINRFSQMTEPALCKAWKVSTDGRRYTLELRRGLQFSDGHPMDADDVVFSFEAYLDEKLHSPQRDLLLVDGKPISVTKIGPHTVQFDLGKPYAAAERIFDSVAILPRHILQPAHAEGKLAATWGLTTDPALIAGMGPFRLKKYLAGDRILLERNPYYWKQDRSGQRLPYLNEIVLVFVASDDAQVIRFQAGETDVISRLSADNFAVLAKEAAERGYRLQDLGPGLEYNFLFFNLNDLSPGQGSPLGRKQAWFKRQEFRRAVSAAIDREGIVRLVYKGRATPLWGHVTPGNRRWLNESLPRPPRSLSGARKLLESAGFRWRSDGVLTDDGGEAVEFSIVTSAGNAQRLQMSTMIQADLRELGMRVNVVSLEFRSLLDRILKTFDYEACVLGLGSGDADPNPEMNVLLSSGGTHLWHPGQDRPATSWEAEIDLLMHKQVVEVRPQERKRLYDRVQLLLFENLPLIYLVSPNVLVGARESLGNFQPAILEPYALWNIEELYRRDGETRPRP